MAWQEKQGDSARDYNKLNRKDIKLLTTLLGMYPFGTLLFAHFPGL